MAMIQKITSLHLCGVMTADAAMASRPVITPHKQATAGGEVS